MDGNVGAELYGQSVSQASPQACADLHPLVILEVLLGALIPRQSRGRPRALHYFSTGLGASPRRSQHVTWCSRRRARVSGNPSRSLPFTRTSSSGPTPRSGARARRADTFETRLVHSARGRPIHNGFESKRVRRVHSRLWKFWECAHGVEGAGVSALRPALPRRLGQLD